MGVSSTQAPGTYSAGTPIPITVTFGEPVTVTGMPQLALNAGGSAAANYTGGSGTSTLTFTYTVAAGQNTSDLDYASTAALGLNDGSVQDVLGNPAVLTLPAMGSDGLATRNIVVATTTVTGVSPSAGPLAGGTTVTITGMNLAQATRVFFGAKAARIKSDTATQIVALSPAGTAGTVDVKVVTAKGTSATSALDQFTYVAVPTVTGITLKSGPLTGSQVTITGTNLLGATVKFGTLAATIIPGGDTGTSIEVASPAEKAGTVNVTVTTAGGTSRISPADKFTYAAAPSIKKIKPASGPEKGGTLVRITGTNLLGATVYFGGVVATNVSDTAGAIVVESPASTIAGPVDVTLTTPSGATAPTALCQFTYTATTKSPVIINSGSIAPDVADLALAALMGQSSPSATIQRKTVDNLMASLLGGGPCVL